MQKIIGTLLLLATFQIIVAQNLDQYEKKMYVDSGDTLLYRLLYPENFDPDEPYPLVLFLHGSGERGADNEKQLIHGASLFLEEQNRKRFPSVVIFPQCPTDSYWAAVNIDRETKPMTFDFDYGMEMKSPLEMTLGLVDQMKVEDFIDQNRLYVMGLSMGGMGTFEAVYRRPDLFAAAVPICGGADVDAYGQKPPHIPFWIFHGDADVVVSVQHSRDMHEKLNDLGVYNSYTEYYGVNHGSWINAFEEPNLLNWVFRMKKESEN